MTSLLIYFFIGLSLSMDAFTLSLSLGTINISKYRILILSIIIGLFHFTFPIIGYGIGNYISNYIIIRLNYFISIIFLFLIYEILRSDNNQELSINISLISLILLAVSVSIDSLTIGLGLGLNNEYILIPSIIFSIFSFLFTIIGFTIGKKIVIKYKSIAKLISITILLILALKYLIIN